jgi:hypothetical protein
VRKRGKLGLLIAELLLLAAAKRLLEDLHGGQQRFLWAQEPPLPVAEGPPDPPRTADRVALLSGRRFGKSEGALRYAAALCMSPPQQPGTPYNEVLYIGLTKDDAKDIARRTLDKLALRYGWRSVAGDPREPNEVRFDWRNGVVTFFGGGRITVVGADDPRLARRLRGREYNLAIVDEAQSFVYIDLKYLCDEILSHTLDDRNGRLFLVGTPGEVEAGYFYEVVWEGLGPIGSQVAESAKHPEWMVVHGAPFENPHNADKRMRRLARLRRKNERIDEEPWVLREFYGEWRPDNRKLMVTVPEELCHITEWKPADDEEFVLSIDWGWDKPSAYVLGAWNPQRHNDLVYLEGWERTEMMLSDHLREIKRYIDHPVYGRSLTIIADPGGEAKTLTEEMRRTYHLPIKDADKTGKRLVIDQLNKDASVGQIKFFNVGQPSAPHLNGVAKQWRHLGWKIDPHTKAREEGEPRHTHDAAVYLRKRVRLELFEERKVIELTPDEMIRRKKERIARRRRRRV